MGIRDDKRLLEINREIQESLQRTIKVPHDEIIRIVAADLLAKYKSAVERGYSSEADMIECVLKCYYLTHEEFELYTT